MEKDKVALIADILNSAGTAHGVYETEQLNGVYDQDWPVWYAQWLVEHGINDHLTQPIDAQHLSAVLIDLNEQHKQSDRRQSWADFTADRLEVTIKAGLDSSASSTGRN